MGAHDATGGSAGPEFVSTGSRDLEEERVAELLPRPQLDLAHALARETERRADVGERRGVLRQEAPLDDLSLARVEDREGPRHVALVAGAQLVLGRRLLRGLELRRQVDQVPV